MIGLQELGTVEEISYTVMRKPYTRHIRLVVSGSGCRVIAPLLVTRATITSFVAGHLIHIRRAMKKFEGRVRLVHGQMVQEDYVANKENARKLIHVRLEHYNRIYGFVYASVRIKRTTSRWGSCSQKKNLNFNYQLVHLPIELVDYVVVHELCHLKEMNHGKDFWKEVARAIPNHKALRSRLSQYSLA